MLHSTPTSPDSIRHFDPTRIVARLLLGLLLAAGVVGAGCASSGSSGPGASAANGPAGIGADVAIDDIDADWIRANYVKDEYRVPMRDGVRLHTTVYRPRGDAGPWPMLMIRTPYSCRPYGERNYPNRLGLNNAYAPGGWIFVQQDVRGKYMSEGEFVNMRPHEPDKSQPYVVDESTDTYDTIEWLLANVEGHNGRVGMWGISYPGFYAAAGMIDAHPALRAVSPQAPIADWWQDDFKHNGAFFMPHAFHFLSSFGQPRSGPTTEGGRRNFEYGTPDGYDWYLNEMGTTKALDDKILKGSIDFWNSLIAHPDRDEFWARRDLVPHLNAVAPAVLTVGGWFDAEDLYGPLSIYQSVEARNPDVDNRLIMGPWVHGGWHRTPGNALGSVHFGEPTSPGYLADIEMPFFEHHLKDGPDPKLAEATVFDTGSQEWRRFNAWPPAGLVPRSLHLRAGGRLAWAAPLPGDAPDTSFVSDPASPVPFTEDTSVRMTREYMVDDQRFAGRRPDVLTFRTEP
ncbi:MAG: CocE/NonD family hydrolase, partial [Phycisphaerales bacterium]